jgi:hypothetical protein
MRIKKCVSPLRKSEKLAMIRTTPSGTDLGMQIFQ